MSHIPNSAMPHAVETAEPDNPGIGQALGERAGKLAELARARPKTAAIAGAAVLAGAVAAAAIPLIQNQRSGGGRSKSGKAKKAA
jgi:hypothetical protein